MNNVVQEAINTHKGGARGLMVETNWELGTSYDVSYFYAWKNGQKKPPATVLNYLRRFVIRQNFKKPQADLLIEMLEPPLVTY